MLIVPKMVVANQFQYFASASHAQVPACPLTNPTSLTLLLTPSILIMARSFFALSLSTDQGLSVHAVGLSAPPFHLR
jgi:hypothetical protein